MIFLLPSEVNQAAVAVCVQDIDPDLLPYHFIFKGFVHFFPNGMLLLRDDTIAALGRRRGVYSIEPYIQFCPAVNYGLNYLAIRKILNNPLLVRIAFLT